MRHEGIKQTSNTYGPFVRREKARSNECIQKEA